MSKINIDFITYSGTEIPELIKNDKYFVVPIVMSEEQINDQTIYTWFELKISSLEYNYENIISIIIGLKYDFHENLAIINNYLFDPTNIKYKQKFDELQAWRFKVKKAVKKHFNIN
jgi:hypothetical protein